MRLLAMVAGGVVLMLVAAAQVPSHLRLPVSAVVPGARVTQPFGCTSLVLEPFDPGCPTHHIHTGIDLAAPLGTAVYSATAGSVIAGYDPGGAGDYDEIAPIAGSLQGRYLMGIKLLHTAGRHEAHQRLSKDREKGGNGNRRKKDHTRQPTQ